MDIRSESLADYAAIAEVNILAFGQENEAKLISEIRDSQGYISELSLVAVVDNVREKLFILQLFWLCK